MDTENNTPTGNATAPDITRERAAEIARAELENGMFHWEVFDTLPEGYTGYMLPNPTEPCWWVVGVKHWVLDGSSPLLCISRKSGRVVGRGDVRSGG